MNASLGRLFKSLVRGRSKELPPPAVSELPLEMDRAVDAWHEGNLGVAETELRNILQLQPRHAGAMANLGMVLFEGQRFDEGLAMLREAVVLDPNLAVAHCNLGIVLAQGGWLREAKEHLETALKLDPKDNVYANLLTLYQQTCDWRLLDEMVDEISSSSDSGQISQWAPRVSPYTAMLLPFTAAIKRQISDYHAQRIAIDHPAFPRTCIWPGNKRTKLRIGYLSCDFHNHPTAHLAAGLFEAHDATRFEMFAYAWGASDGSEYRRRIVTAFTSFHDISAESFRETAERIVGDGIDILVDLKGHTGGGRPEILAYRPAPVQVNYLGCPGTLGGNLADYFITDAVATPPGSEAEFSECLVFLPNTYQINDALTTLTIAPSRSELGLPDSAFVFCCFNQLYKIEPKVFSCWTKILRAVPGSVLWLLNSNEYAAEQFRISLLNAGVDLSRVIFAPALPRHDHLVRLQQADLFLDTHFVNAHTSASDALRAGVPVLTWTGDTFASRVATSLLHAAGIPEMAVTDAESYVELAVRFAHNPSLLDLHRSRLLERRTSPLFDTGRYARNLERAYERMWDRIERSLPPQTIRITED